MTEGRTASLRPIILPSHGTDISGLVYRVKLTTVGIPVSIFKQIFSASYNNIKNKVNDQVNKGVLKKSEELGLHMNTNKDGVFWIPELKP